MDKFSLSIANKFIAIILLIVLLDLAKIFQKQIISALFASFESRLALFVIILINSKLTSSIDFLNEKTVNLIYNENSFFYFPSLWRA